MNKRMLILTTIFVALTLALIVYRVTPWNSLPSELNVADARVDFTSTEITSSHAFRSTLRWLSLSSLVINVVALSALGFTSLGTRLIGRLPGGPIVKTVIAVAVITAITTALRLPVAIASEEISRREGLSVSTWGTWLSDVMKSFALSVVLVASALAILGALARWQPRTWWAFAAAGAATVAMALSFLFPVLVEPLFNRFTPMPDGSLRTSLLELAKRDGLEVSDVLVADASRRTTALNAYVSGFGSTRRIVVYDTLVREAPAEEVRMVVAHELGHAKDRDVLTGTLIGSLAAALMVLVLALGVGTRIGAPSSVALLLALVAWFGVLQQPISSAISRQVEARADRHALELTADPERFAQMQRRLALTNRADVIAPHWAYLLFATHPSTRERIALARWWAQRSGIAVPLPLVQP